MMDSTDDDGYCCNSKEEMITQINNEEENLGNYDEDGDFHPDEQLCILKYVEGQQQQQQTNNDEIQMSYEELLADVDALGKLKFKNYLFSTLDNFVFSNEFSCNIVYYQLDCYKHLPDYMILNKKTKLKIEYNISMAPLRFGSSVKKIKVLNEITGLGGIINDTIKCNVTAHLIY